MLSLILMYVNANTTCMLMLAVAVSLMLMYANLANVCATDQKRQMNSTSKRTRKNFFPMSNLKLIFMTKNNLPTNFKETNSSHSNRRCLIGHHRMANLLPSISLLKKMPRKHPKTQFQQKPQILKIFLKNNGLPTKILKLGTTSSSNQPTKAVPWSFGAPNFTNKKLLDNWPTLNSMQK